LKQKRRACSKQGAASDGPIKVDRLTHVSILVLPLFEDNHEVRVTRSVLFAGLVRFFTRRETVRVWRRAALNHVPH
jgi:hypothetical protein